MNDPRNLSGGTLESEGGVRDEATETGNSGMSLATDAGPIVERRGDAGAAHQISVVFGFRPRSARPRRFDNSIRMKTRKDPQHRCQTIIVTKD